MAAALSCTAAALGDMIGIDTFSLSYSGLAVAGWVACCKD